MSRKTGRKKIRQAVRQAAVKPKFTATIYPYIASGRYYAPAMPRPEGQEARVRNKLEAFALVTGRIIGQATKASVATAQEQEV